MVWRRYQRRHSASVVAGTEQADGADALGLNLDASLSCGSGGIDTIECGIIAVIGHHWHIDSIIFGEGLEPNDVSFSVSGKPLTMVSVPVLPRNTPSSSVF